MKNYQKKMAKVKNEKWNAGSPLAITLPNSLKLRWRINFSWGQSQDSHFPHASVACISSLVATASS